MSVARWALQALFAAKLNDFESKVPAVPERYAGLPSLLAFYQVNVRIGLYDPRDPAAIAYDRTVPLHSA